MNISWPTVLIVLAIIIAGVVLIVTGHPAEGAMFCLPAVALAGALPQMFKRPPETTSASVTTTTTATAPTPKDGAP